MTNLRDPKRGVARPRVFITVADDKTDDDIVAYRFRRVPGLSAHVILTHAVSALTSRRGLTRVQARIVDALSESQLAAVSVMTHVQATYAPGGAIPEEIDTPSSWGGSDAIAGADVVSVEEHVKLYFGNHIPDRWSTVLERPDHWLAQVASAHRGIAPIIGDVWAAAQPQVSFEQYRFDVALAGGDALASFVNTSRPFELDADVVSMPYPVETRMSVPGPLYVAPLVTDPDQPLLLSRARSLVLGYPLGRPAGTPGISRSEARLDILLGPARASLLRAATGSRTMGDLARDFHYAPSTLTHHAKILERSGLVTLRRERSNVYPTRTSAGEILLDLLA